MLPQQPKKEEKKVHSRLLHTEIATWRGKNDSLITSHLFAFSCLYLTHQAQSWVFLVCVFLSCWCCRIRSVMSNTTRVHFDTSSTASASKSWSFSIATMIGSVYKTREVWNNQLPISAARAGLWHHFKHWCSMSLFSFKNTGIYKKPHRGGKTNWAS